jgi:hypothetical protein
LTSITAAASFVSAFFWRLIGDERFGVQVERESGYVGRSGPEVYQVAYVILIAAAIILILAIAKLNSRRQRRWWLPLGLALATILTILMPPAHWLPMMFTRSGFENSVEQQSLAVLLLRRP